MPPRLGHDAAEVETLIAEATMAARTAVEAEPMDGRVALVGLLSGVLVTVLTPPGHWGRLAGEAALVGVAHVGLWRYAASSGDGSARRLLGRAALLAPFLLLVVVSLPFMAAAPGQAPAWERAGMAVARAFISFGAVAAALLAVDATELLQALSRLRAPALFVTLTALMLRYLDLLEGEARRMIRARDLRGTPPTLRARARVAGWMVGSLFVRGFERAERLSVAMQARGFTGLLPPAPPRPLTRRGWMIAGALLLAQALLIGVT